MLASGAVAFPLGSRPVCFCYHVVSNLGNVPEKREDEGMVARGLGWWLLGLGFTFRASVSHSDLYGTISRHKSVVLGVTAADGGNKYVRLKG